MNETLQATLEVVKKELLKQIELRVKAEVEQHFDAKAAELFDKLKAAIPGQTDDVLLNIVQTILVPELKKMVLAYADKISADV